MTHQKDTKKRSKLAHGVKSVPKIPANAKLTERKGNPHHWTADADVDSTHHRWRFEGRQLVAHCTYDSNGEFQGYDWVRRTARAA